MSTQASDHDGICYCARSKSGNAPDPSTSSTNRQALLTTVFTFGISAFHASRTSKDTTFAFGFNIPAWEAVRKFNSILLAALVAALFKVSAQLDPIFWFLITCSLSQAATGLICSTILIVVFSGCYDQFEYHSIREDQLRLLFWTIWDQFSLPAIMTVWSVFLFIIALIVDAVRPIVVQSNCSGQVYRDSHFTVAKVMLLLVLCFVAVRFGIFMAHLRRILQALGQPESA